MTPTPPNQVVSVKPAPKDTVAFVNSPVKMNAMEGSRTPVTIEIGAGRSANGLILYNKREVKRTELDVNLKEIALTSTKTPIIVKCSTDSPHKALVDVLDICYRHGLFSVSIFTL
jgi:biopolymer transport protein ExbD